MGATQKRLLGYQRSASTAALVAVVLLTAWMGAASGGYFVASWALAVFSLAALIAVGASSGVLRGTLSPWSATAVGLFTLYAAWTCASAFWSSNRGDAWVGAGQTLLYLLAFGVAVALVTAGASRRWALVASVLGPALVGSFTLSTLAGDLENRFDDYRMSGTVGYHNGEAAFLLVPFWVAIYLAGSRRANPVLRGLVLAGATLFAQLAVLTQSRGAMVAVALSLPIYFALSAARLRGFLALIPAVAALLLSFSDLNAVYLSFLNDGDPAVALERVVPVVWLTTLMAGVYGLGWGLLDLRWEPPAVVSRVFGRAVLVVAAAVLVLGAAVFEQRVGDPVAYAGQKWEAFKNNDLAGQDRSRYLSASGSGRYAYWQVAWKDFVEHPLIGVGTHNYEATYYQLREQDVGYVRQPHMLPLEILAERGIVGGALFLGFLGVCLGAGLRRFGQLNAEGKAVVGALVAAVTYWFVHSSAEWFWQMPAVTLPAMVYLAMLAAPWGRAEAAPPGWGQRAAVSAAAVLVAAVVAPLYAADLYLARSYATDNPWVALESVERAQRFVSVDPLLFQREAELAIQIGDWPRVREAYGEAIRLDHEHYAPYTLLAKFYEWGGEPGEALTLYREALALNPLDKELQQSVERLEATTGANL